MLAANGPNRNRPKMQQKNPHTHAFAWARIKRIRFNVSFCIEWIERRGKTTSPMEMNIHIGSMNSNNNDGNITQATVAAPFCYCTQSDEQLNSHWMWGTQTVDKTIMPNRNFKKNRRTTTKKKRWNNATTCVRIRLSKSIFRIEMNETSEMDLKSVNFFLARQFHLKRFNEEWKTTLNTKCAQREQKKKKWN